MMMVAKYFVILFLMFSCYYKTNAESIEDFIEFLRSKVRRLEQTKRITRDYEPYIQSEFQDKEEYDFIIVGAGSSGSAVVHRLTEISKWKILLLEAGGEPDILSDIPMWSPICHLTDLNWKFRTEKEDNFGLGLEDQRMHWPRGKALGGSSLLNYMVFSRGDKEDYNKWARQGNWGWSYADVLPYFKKLETCKINRKDEKFRGNSGPIFVEDPDYKSVAAKTFVEAAKNAGYRYIDYNAEKLLGVSHAQMNTKNGLRCSGERGYIKVIKNRKNLTIQLNSHVTKVLIKDRAAYGVEFVKNGKTYTAIAKKEVILSAGVINSAHILLLSGIGPTDQLKKFNVEPILDLPVGRKIYDHPAYWGLGFTLNESIGYDVQKALEDEAFVKLYNEGKGILHTPSRVETLLFTKTPLAPNDVADIEMIFLPTHFSEDINKGLGRTVGISKDMYDKMFRPYENQIAVSVVPILMHPDSYGHMELQSNDPFVHPKIYGGYFTDPKGFDKKTMTAGIREAIRIMQKPPFDKYDVKVIETKVPGCETLPYDSDPYWECALSYLTSTVFHHTTTCKMGPANDLEAVVDNRLRVYGIANLRVADTSIIPVQITGHTNVPAFMVGEKAADIIKEEYLRL